jgi:hypothetical protein
MSGYDPIDSNVPALSNADDVPKIDVRGEFLKSAREFATAAEVATWNLANRAVIYIAEYARWFKKDTGDTTTATGEGLVRDINGLAFKALSTIAVGVDAVGEFSDRDDYDDEAEGFVYLSTDGNGAEIEDAVLYVKLSVADADWSAAILLRGERGGDRYEISNWDTDRPASGEELIAHLFTTDAEFAAAFLGSKAKATVASTGSAVYSVKKNGSNIGTLTFSSGDVNGVFALVNATAFAANDRFSVVAPDPRDATLSGVAITFVATRN